MEKSIFMQHPLNAATLSEKYPPFDPQVYNTKYIVLAKSGRKPTDEMVDSVRTNLIEYCRSVDDEAQFKKDVAGIEGSWPEMRVRFQNSIGLTQMMLDWGCKSRYFYSYLYLTGRKLFFVALEMKDGYAIPVSLEQKFEKIPEDDWSFIVALEEASHKARRVTDGSVQKLLRKAKRNFEAGPGLLPAYRRYGYPLGQNGQEIFACDSDPRVLEYLPLVFDKPLEAYGITYRIANVLEEMDNPEHFGKYDVVRATGLLSYFSKEEKILFLHKAKRLLRKGGIIIADLQTLGEDMAKSSLVRSGLINLWPMDPNDAHKLTPAVNVMAAKQEIAEICQAAGLSYVERVDFCNGNPLCLTQAAASPKCVMFIAGRVSDDVSDEMFDDVPELNVYAKR